MKTTRRFLVGTPVSPFSPFHSVCATLSQEALGGCLKTLWVLLVLAASWGILAPWQASAQNQASFFPPFSNSLTTTGGVAQGGTAQAVQTTIPPGAPVAISVIVASPAGTGSPVTGEPEGTTLANAGIPSIRDSGFKAFAAVLRTGSVFINAILSGTDLPVLVRQGDFAPDARGNPDTGAVFVSFDDPLINDLGNTAFLAEIAGPGVTSKTRFGLWTNAFGPLAEVARTGLPAPGVDNTTLDSIDSVVLEGGTGAFLAFTGRLAPKSGSVTGNNDRALWGVNQQGATLLLREGSSITLGGTASVIKRFVALGIVRGSPGQGRAADANSLVTQIFLTNGLEAILLLSPETSPQVVAIKGETVDAVPSAFLAGFGTPTLTQSGVVGGLVYFQRQRGTISASNDAAILVAGTSDDYAHVLAREGDPAPGIPGAVFKSLGNPVINSQGVAAFTATISGEQNGRSALFLKTNLGTNFGPHGVWWGTPGNLHLLAKEGDLAPGTSSRFASFLSLALPEGGGIGPMPIIAASLAGPGNRTGVWTVTSLGNLVLVALGGQSGSGLTPTALDVLGIVPGSPAQPRSYNSNRELIYRLTFQNGDQWIIIVFTP